MKVLVIQNPFGFEIPVGGVVLWYGDSNNVPAGYEIYEELKGYAPYGGESVDLTARGSATHKHSYGATTVELKADHQHTVNANISGSAGGVGLGYWSGYDKAAEQYHVHGASGNTGNAGSHRHTIGDTEYASSLNSYYKLYYIRRVS